MEFKNLAEVTQLTEVPEGASVLAATAEGEVVRVPGDGLGGSGGGVFWVTLSAEDDESIVADKTYQEIKQAVNEGQFVKIRDDGSITGDGQLFGDLMICGGMIRFAAEMHIDTTLYRFHIIVFPTDVVKLEEYTIALTQAS